MSSLYTQNFKHQLINNSNLMSNRSNLTTPYATTNSDPNQNNDLKEINNRLDQYINNVKENFLWLNLKLHEQKLILINFRHI